MKGIQAALLLSAGMLMVHPNIGLAGPQGGQIVGGQGNINTPDVNTTLVHQQSQNMAVEWQSFNVESQELVRFQQPSASSAVLNRILDQNPSQIFGAIEANGRVFLANPNGIIFSPTASVNVGSLIAAGLDMDSAKFMNGQYEMGVPDGQTPGKVINQGLIKAATGGSVTLVGGAVSNEGLIVADVGYVTLASGRKAIVDFEGTGAIRFRVDESVLENSSGTDAAVNNSGEIRADGGTIVMAGHTARDIFSQVVNNDGILRAGSIDLSGEIVVLGGTINAVDTLSITSTNIGNETVSGGGVITTTDSVELDVQDGVVISTDGLELDVQDGVIISTDGLELDVQDGVVINSISNALVAKISISKNGSLGRAISASHITDYAEEWLSDPMETGQADSKTVEGYGIYKSFLIAPVNLDMMLAKPQERTQH